MRTHRRSLMTVPAVLVLTLGAFAAPIAAADPAGNNGTVKVDTQNLDLMPDNQTQADCVFWIDFYGFDSGASATVTFTVIAPTVDTEISFDMPAVSLGTSDSSGGGSLSGHDTRVPFDLNDELAGYMGPDGQGSAHVKLTVHASGATNADTKYKAFWVSGCEYPNQET